MWRIFLFYECFTGMKVVLTQSKKSKLEVRINQLEVDVFAIVEAGVYDIVRFNFKNCIIYNLNKSRKIAGGILFGLRNLLAGKFSVVKKMEGVDNKSDIAKLDVWKE
ncbi:hypothetical protein TNIN_450321 [Trichonephila inaurata madagascariensis]|uniref:Uncharacterized protein n=1 Tax=Trichonephila inaurata madagascariensis TaxID=2747483 RepID=A0A8X6YLH3_9ARAC|nr:hypothetical protein TNIN_450321 [Trichonephila inaurata madagascariensis]